MSALPSHIPLPPRARTGEPVRASDFNRLRDALQLVLKELAKRTPRPSPDVGHKFGSEGGFTSHLKRSNGGGGIPGVGRFTVRPGGTNEEGGQLFKIAEGLVYERNIQAESEDGDEPLKLHWPELDGVKLNADPPPLIAVGGGQSIYVRVRTNTEDTISSVTIEVDAPEKSSIHAEPSSSSSSGVEGDYWYEIAKIGSDPQVEQLWESDIVHTVDFLHENTFSGVEMLKGFDPTEKKWKHKGANGLYYGAGDQEEGPDPEPWKAKLDALTEDELGIEVVDGGDSADFSPVGAEFHLKFKYVQPEEIDGSGSEADWTGREGRVEFLRGMAGKYVPVPSGEEGQEVPSEFIKIPIGGGKYYAGNGVVITEDDQGQPAQPNVVRLYESPDADGLAADGVSPSNGGFRVDSDLGFWKADVCVNGQPGHILYYGRKAWSGSTPGAGTADPDSQESLPPPPQSGS